MALTTQDRIGIGQCYNLAVEIMKHNLQEKTYVIAFDLGDPRTTEESLKLLTKKLFDIKTEIEAEVEAELDELRTDK